MVAYVILNDFELWHGFGLYGFGYELQSNGVNFDSYMLIDS